MLSPRAIAASICSPANVMTATFAGLGPEPWDCSQMGLRRTSPSWVQVASRRIHVVLKLEVRVDVAGAETELAAMDTAAGAVAILSVRDTEADVASLQCAVLISLPFPFPLSTKPRRLVSILFELHFLLESSSRDSLPDAARSTAAGLGAF